MSQRLRAHSATLATLRLRVTSAAESILRSGHPWLFANAIREENRPGRLGELAVIYDRNDRFLAVALYDPNSPIRARVLHVGRPQVIDRAWWRARLDRGVARRKGLFDERTTGYRLINGESDGWPGLVLDRYHTALVLKLYTAAWLPRLDEVAGLLCQELNPERLVFRLSRNVRELARQQFGLEDGCCLPGVKPPKAKGQDAERAGFAPANSSSGPPVSSWDADTGQVEFLESGLRLEADVIRGQKTGFFLDQRENRRRVETLARGCDLLNAFSFTGGFSLYAARGGARSVLDLDISPHALAGARRNFLLNRNIAAAASCNHETIQADAFEWLESAPERNFDLVILDPPSLAKRESERAAAIRAYGVLARLGIARLRRGGILVAASCSAHVSAAEFFAAVRSAARRTRRSFRELDTTGPAPDHPATFAEANYLKCIYLGF